MDKPIMLAACGLDCGSCEIRLAATDPAAAKVVVDWFRKEGWPKEDEGIEQAIKGSMLCGSSANVMPYCTILLLNYADLLYSSRIIQIVLPNIFLSA